MLHRRRIADSFRMHAENAEIRSIHSPVDIRVTRDNGKKTRITIRRLIIALYAYNPAQSLYCVNSIEGRSAAPENLGRASDFAFVEAPRCAIS